MSKYKIGDKLIVEITGMDDYGYYTVGGEDFHERSLDKYFKKPETLENEVWDLAQNIELMNVGEAADCFGDEYYDAPFVIPTMSYRVAKGKYDAWKKRNAVEVGDEVILGKQKALVIEVDDDATYVMYNDDHDAEWVEGGAKKTGRHFDLKPMFKFMEGHE